MGMRLAAWSAGHVMRLGRATEEAARSFWHWYSHGVLDLDGVRILSGRPTRREERLMWSMRSLLWRDRIPDSGLWGMAQEIRRETKTNTLTTLEGMYQVVSSGYWKREDIVSATILVLTEGEAALTERVVREASGD